MDDMQQQRREVTSAMYYMVWHLGLPYATAERVIEQSKAALEHFARLGHIEGRMCFRALSRLVASINIDPPSTRNSR